MSSENPIIKEFIKLKLISKKNLNLLSTKTRDKKIRVFIDKKTKVILLEKYIRNINYYKKQKIKNIKLKKYINLMLVDDKRRFEQFKSTIKGKKILDFGCEYAGFLNIVNNTKKKNGFEINLNCLKYIKKNLKKIKTFSNLSNLNEKFEVITMFHVLEHMPNQLDTLLQIKNNLYTGGKLIIEVPCANDFLLSFNELKYFRKFIFWSEHLVLHTAKSIEKILKVSGFKNIKIMNYQRYNMNNHLGWFLNDRPNGHKTFSNVFDSKLNQSYKEFLSKIKKTDTLIATATK